MKEDNTVVGFNTPEFDALQALLKEGAQALLSKAIEAEVSELLSTYDMQIDGKRMVVRNGYLPERMIQTGLGDIPVKVPKVRDRSNQGLNLIVS